MLNRDQLTVPDSLLERHLAFWERRPVKQALIRVDKLGRIDLPPVQMVYGKGAGQPIGPEQADADRYLATIDWDTLTLPGQADLFDVLPPYVRIPWLEAVAGCRVIPHPDSDSVWSREPDPPLVDPRAIDIKMDWLSALVAQTERLSSDNSIPCPTAQTLLRGPGDLAEAMLGGETLCLAMMDEADWLEPFLTACTDLFIKVAQVQLETIRPLLGGYFNFFGFWSPQPCVRVQDDVMRILSPQLYRTWLRPGLERIVQTFPYSMFHIHSGSLNMLDEVTSVAGLNGLEVAVDEPPFAVPIVEQIDILRKAQERLPLFIEGMLSDQDMEKLLAGLKPTGLALRAY